MAIKLNEVRIAGNLGQDPDLKTAQSGDAVVSFSIAVTDRWKDKNSGEQKERTEWVKCVAWGQPANFLGQYGKKGDNVYVEGKLETRNYEKDGQKVYVTEVKASNIQLASRMNEATQGQRQDHQAPIEDDSIPFNGSRGNQPRPQGRGNYQDRRTREPAFA